MRIFSFAAGVAILLLACSDDDPPTVPTADAGSDASETVRDAGNADSSNVPTASTCTLAKNALASTADAQAPVLDASKSQLQRVASNDAFCTGQKATHSDFGAHGYLLNIAYTDAEGDAPDLSDLTGTPGLVRFGSAPDTGVDKKYDPQHGWTTQGGGASGTIILQLCLDQVRAAGAFTIAVDLADKAGHRSSAICITEPTGG